MNKEKIIGKKVNVIVDRPLGTFHPKYPETFYPINYGYVKEYMSGDGEYQDVYILGVDKPVKRFIGRVIAIIHRHNDEEDKWVVASEDVHYTKEYIYNQVYFQEKYFEFTIENDSL